MARIEPFEEYTSDYEQWFEDNKWVYLSEMEAIRKLLPERGIGLEIGVGSGRFAEPLGIRIGVEPSRNMARIARRRGIEIVEGVAENLPFEDSSFDHALMVTTICFVDDIDQAFSEAFRVLKPRGSLIVGFVNSESPIGMIYQKHKDQSAFYRDATFYSAAEVEESLERAGFKDFRYAQTIFRDPKDIREVEPVRDGLSEGSFVVIKAEKQVTIKA